MGKRKIKKHKKKIVAIKTLLFAFVFLLSLTIVFFLLYKNKNDRIDIQYKSTEDKKPEAAKIINPQLLGLDKNEKPYTLDATSGVQATESHVTLKDVKGKFKSKDNTDMNISARDGELFLEENGIELGGGVEVIDEKGNKLTTEKMQLFYETNAAKGEDHVVLEGDLGTINAEGFDIPEGAEEIKFTGRVKANIKP